jgi:hypothetical protein
MTLGHLVRVTTAGGITKAVHYIVGEHDFEKAVAIVMSAPRQFVEV